MFALGKLRAGTVAVLASATLAACGGGATTGGAPFGGSGSGTGPSGGSPASSASPSGTSTSPASASGPTQVQFSITFPARTAASAIARRDASRRPHYVSPSIQSLTFSIDGATPYIVNAPPANGSSQTIVTTEPATAGSHTILAAEYDQANGAGQLLGRVSQTNVFTANTTNVVPYVLNGQLAKIVIDPPVSPFLEGSMMVGYVLVGAGAQTFTAVPEDADGNTIVTPGLLPSLSPTSASPTAVVPTAGPDNTFTLEAPVQTQDGAYIAVTVSGVDLDGNTVTSPTIEVKSIGAFYIADFTAQVIRVFDEAGTPLKLPASSFAGIQNPEGLAYVPGNPGSILVTQTADASAPYILSFDQFGNPQTVASTAFPGLSRPLFLGYGSVGNGQIYVPDYFNNTLSVYDTSGNQLPAPGGNFGTGLNPVAAAYDPNDRQVYVTNDGSDTLTSYDASGEQIGTVSTGSHPMGVAYDANNKSLYVTYAGTEGATTDGGTPQLPGITEFTEAPAAVSNTGGFTNASTTAYFTGIAVDTFAKQIYVADAGNVAIDAYSETGTPVTLATGAFSTISATTTPPSDPMAILFVP